MTDFECLQLARDGDVLRVTIDHPRSKINAIDGVLHEELATLVRDLRRERQARAILLTGSKGFFSAGGNLRWMPELQEPGAFEELRLDAKQLIWDLLDVPQPIVCAVNGAAVGLGATIALLCDVVFMGASATIADPHVRVGIVAGDGGTVAWPLAVGPARAKRYLLTGDAIGAVEAERIGLITDVVPDDELDAAALAFAHRLAAGAPLAVQYTKQSVNALVKQALSSSFDQATALELVTFRSEDHAEALRAAAEKRPPTFKGI